MDNVPSSLRAASIDIDGKCIIFRAIFDSKANRDARELLSIVASEVIADFGNGFTITEEYVDCPMPEEMTHLRLLLYKRNE